MTCREARLLLGMNPRGIHIDIMLMVADHLQKCPACEEWLSKGAALEEQATGPLTQEEIRYADDFAERIEKRANDLFAKKPRP